MASVPLLCWKNSDDVADEGVEKENENVQPSTVSSPPREVVDNIRSRRKNVAKVANVVPRRSSRKQSEDLVRRSPRRAAVVEKKEKPTGRGGKTRVGSRSTMKDVEREVEKEVQIEDPVVPLEKKKKRKRDQEPVKKSATGETGKKIKMGAEQSRQKRSCESAFFLYRKDKIVELRKEQPRLKMTSDVEAQIREEWKLLSVDDQKLWRDQSEEAKKLNEKMKSEGLLPEKVKKGVRKEAKKEAAVKVKKEMEKKVGFKSPVSLFPVTKVLGNLNEEQKKVLWEIGLGGLLHLKCTYIPKPIMAWLLKNFDPLDHSLTVHGRTLKIDVNDVGRLLGVSSDGEIALIQKSTREVQALWGELELEEGQSGVAGFMRYFDEIKSKDAGVEFQRRIVLLLMAMFGVPSCKGGLRSTLVNLVMDVSKLKKYNWAKLIFDYLMSSLSRFKDGTQKGVGGCTFLLLVCFN